MQHGTSDSQSMFTAVATIVIVLLLIATACDLRTREIPDWVLMAIIVAACVGAGDRAPRSQPPVDQRNHG